MRTKYRLLIPFGIPLHSTGVTSPNPRESAFRLSSPPLRSLQPSGHPAS
jgi:hypothetical protein